MATASHALLVSNEARALLNKGLPPIALTRAHEMIPIYAGTDVTAANAKVLTVAGILATDIVIALASSAAGTITNAACTANTITFAASAAVVPFQFIVLRPTAP
jgi:hypothetical protein